MEDVAGDLAVTRDLIIPAHELVWRFSRSSGPGGQSVNTTDSRVSLSWDPRTSPSLSIGRRDLLVARLALNHGGLLVVASDHRSQWQNRRAARLRLAEQLRAALAPRRRKRRPTRPSRSSVERRLAAKRRRSSVKRDRAAPHPD